MNKRIVEAFYESSNNKGEKDGTVITIEEDDLFNLLREYNRYNNLYLVSYLKQHRRFLHNDFKSEFIVDNFETDRNMACFK